MIDESIELCAYDSAWPRWYSIEAARILAAFSVKPVLEHIGSTAVPGLLAKPVIDIMLGREAHMELSLLRAKLADLGYEDCGEAGVAGRIYLRHRGERAFNVAIVERAGALWEANLALRDYLRQDAGAREDYAEVKRRAWSSGMRALLAYSESKGPAVTSLLAKAMRHRRGDTART